MHGHLNQKASLQENVCSSSSAFCNIDQCCVNYYRVFISFWKEDFQSYKKNLQFTKNFALIALNKPLWGLDDTLEVEEQWDNRRGKQSVQSIKNLRSGPELREYTVLSLQTRAELIQGEQIWCTRSPSYSSAILSSIFQTPNYAQHPHSSLLISTVIRLISYDIISFHNG